MDIRTIIIIILIIILIIWFIFWWVYTPSCEGFSDLGEPKIPSISPKKNCCGINQTEGLTPPYQINQAMMLRQMLRANEQPSNSYYELWNTERKLTGDYVANEAENIMQSGATCLSYDNINQCMSQCTSSDGCNGFYVSEPGTCCLTYNPKFDTRRTSMLDVPNSRLQDTYRSISDYIRNKQITEGKPVFEKIGGENIGDSMYRVPLDRKSCRSLCPKCVLGQCPRNYRCKDIQSDPRQNNGCIITNEDRYDETEGLTFDSDKLNFLNPQYQIQQDAGIIPDEYEPLSDTDYATPGVNKLDKMFVRDNLWKNNTEKPYLASFGENERFPNRGKWNKNTPNVQLEAYQRFDRYQK